jgi:hypothetical protein
VFVDFVLEVSAELEVSIDEVSFLTLGSGFQNSLALYHNPLGECSGAAFSQALLCQPPPR